MATDLKQLERVLYGDDAQYLHLFPHRDSVPAIETNPLLDVMSRGVDVDEFLVGLMLDRRYIGWTTHQLLNIKLFSQQMAVLQTLWSKPFPMLIATRGGSKSFMLAVYCVLRAIFDQGVKIVIVGAGLRQAKLVFNYIESIWEASPVLRGIVGAGKKSGPRSNVDRCYFNVGLSSIVALPLGDGTKIRGERANVVIADEFASIPEEIFDIVVRGFAATARTPVEEARRAALERRLEQLKVPLEIRKQVLGAKAGGNQIIYSGTAYYAFNHFARRFEMWRNIIRSKGDPERVAEIFGSETGVPEDFDWRDYAVIRIPHTHVPEGLLDKRQLAHAKAILPRSIYQMEYGACATADLVVDALSGARPIAAVDTGDRVLTHTGRYQSVVARKYRYYVGEMVELQIGINEPIRVTADHQVWNGQEFVAAGSLSQRSTTILPSPPLATHTVFDLAKTATEHCRQVVDGQSFIYPRPSRAVHADVLARTRTSARYYRPNQRFKSSVPRYVEAGFDLGLVLGCYAADGAIGAGGKQLQIAFNIQQGDRAQRFASAVQAVFGLRSKCRPGPSDNTLKATVNSRMVCDFVRAMIGTGAQTKRVHELERYTPQMACGFIAGYWMGDGFSEYGNPQAASVGRSLLADIRMLLLAVGCYAGIRDKNNPTTCVIKGKQYEVKPAWTLRVPRAHQARFVGIINGMPSRRPVRVPVRKKAAFEYRGYVYNLEVEGDHSYFAGGGIHHNCFVMDSDGFYPRSLIEACTTSEPRPIDTPDGAVAFAPLMRGKSGRKYVMGIDPAAERDNLAITVVEVWPHHARIVHCWAVNRKEFDRRKRAGVVTARDYYAYCCSKIRELVGLFGPVRIEMDSQGGGPAIAEMLRNTDLLDRDKAEKPIYETIDLDDPKHTDGETDGPHILHLVKQANEWNAQTNLFLHKAFETRSLLFPAFDTVRMQAALEIEKALNVTIDTFEDCVANIEELKNELCTIQMQQTATGKEKFDTPQRVSAGTVEGRPRKGRLRKDRYSSLMFAHRYVHDTTVTPDVQIDYEDVAGNVAITRADSSEGMYRGPGASRMVNARDWLHGDSALGATKNGEQIK